MILCDNVKCPMGWYHKKCVGLDEDFTADRWLCNQCLDKWQGIEYAEFESEEIDEEIREASDSRIQRIKTLARVWKDHQWPNPVEVCHLIDRTSCRININERRIYDTVKDVNIKESYESRCWAILRGSPKVMRAIRPVDGKRSSGTNRTTQNLKHRKSDYDVPSLAANSSMIPRQSSGRLSLPQ
jgi:hypothetical protein